MSITNALANALSGLNAVSRSASVVSSNVANAMTDGHSRREIELTSQTLGRTGAGVTVVGVNRITDPVVTGERRLADGDVTLGETRQQFFDRFAQEMGQANEESSITGHIVSFETSLIHAASMPNSEPRLVSVLNAAQTLTEKINDTADFLLGERMRADKEIGESVDLLQASLEKVVELNVAIQQRTTSGHETNSLLDQRAAIIDRISEIVPVKELRRPNNMVALISSGGAILVDSKAATLSFDSVPTISPDMTLENGALSGLMINGQPVSTNAERGPIAGGKLAGLFEVRDVSVTDAQTKLDAFARDLIERFETSDVDPSLSLGDAGLFTDLDTPLNVANELGLANRLSVNASVDPDNGGQIRRLRDGIGSAIPGEEGNATLLVSMKNAMHSSRVAASGGFSPSARSASEFSSDFYSLVETKVLSEETNLSFLSARQESYRSLELEAGVDTDAEMQKLLLIERSYAANAKVIETVDSLINQLIGML